MDNTEILKEIKKEFLAFRNGIIADTLRKAGMPHKVIFGLLLPQLSAIARSILEKGLDVEKRNSLGDALWDDSEVRESRLLAPYIYDPENLGLGKTLDLASSVRTREEADILAFRLLKRLPYRDELLTEMQNDSERYLHAIPALRTHLE